MAKKSRTRSFFPVLLATVMKKRTKIILAYVFFLLFIFILMYFITKKFVARNAEMFLIGGGNVYPLPVTLPSSLPSSLPKSQPIELNECTGKNEGGCCYFGKGLCFKEKEGVNLICKMCPSNRYCAPDGLCLPLGTAVGERIRRIKGIVRNFFN